jgi:hypothetical protein
MNESDLQSEKHDEPKIFQIAGNYTIRQFVMDDVNQEAILKLKSSISTFNRIDH